jgi:hypothetical protein
MQRGIYQHYKGKLYLVLGEGLAEADLTPMVVYQALYDDYTLWLRSREDFFSEVLSEEAAYSGPRFQFVREWMEEDGLNHPKRIAFF